MKKRLIVNLLPIPGNNLYGVGQYLKSVLFDIFNNLEDTEVCFIHHSNTNPLKLFSLPEHTNITFISIRFLSKYRILRILFEQIILPFICIKFDTLFVPANIKPLVMPTTCKTIITIYDLLPFISTSRYNFAQSLYLKLGTYLSAKSSDKVITCSNYSKLDIVQKLKIPLDKIEVIYFGILEYCNDSSNKSPLDHPFFLIIAGLNIDKRIDLVIYSFFQFSSKNPNCSLIILGGDQGDLSRLELLVTNLGMNSRIIFKGFVDEKTKWSFLHNCLALILFGKNEGFGIPVLEAISLGKPVVVSNSGSLPEVAGHVGFIVDPYDSDALSLIYKKIYQGFTFNPDDINSHLSKFSITNQSKLFWNCIK
jgi:glycosyltransferase involved in cell wall biosynthesis